MKSSRLPFLLLLFVLLFKFCAAQEIVNGGFEMINGKKEPRNWNIDNQQGKYLITIDPIQPHTGKNAVMIKPAGAADKQKALLYNAFGLASDKKIKTIELSVWVKMTTPADSAVSLFVQNLRGDVIIRTYANKAAEVINGWQKLNLSFSPAADRPWYGCYYGIEAGNKTTVACDNLSLKIDGSPVIDPLGMNYEPAQKTIQWLNEHLYDIKDQRSVNKDRSLIPVGKLCAGAQVVGIGEPTHGTHEAFQFKLRLLEYLVKEKGFNTIALEEVIPTCDIMDATLNDNAHAVKDSLLSQPFYKCWKTAEIAAMFDWIGRYNYTHTHKVKLIGIDMEDIRCRSSREQLKLYAGQHSPELLKAARITDIAVTELIKLSNREGQEAQTRKLADSVKQMLVNMQVLVANTAIANKDQQFKLQTYINVCQQWLESRFYNGSRDQFMADNIAFYVKNHPGARVLVWAHNFHIANVSSKATKQMGAYLKIRFGSKYVPIGFTSAGGTYTAATDASQKLWRSFPIENSYRGTYEYILAKAKSSNYFLPLNTPASRQKAAAWLQIPMMHLDIAYIKADDGDYHFYGNLSDVFDGVVFYKKTSASYSYLK